MNLNYTLLISHPVKLLLGARGLLRPGDLRQVHRDQVSVLLAQRRPAGRGLRRPHRDNLGSGKAMQVNYYQFLYGP